MPRKPATFERDAVEGLLCDELPTLVVAALRSDPHRVRVSVARLMGQLRAHAPRLASLLDDAVRDSVPTTASTATRSFVGEVDRAPVDRDTGSDLLRVVPQQPRARLVLPASVEATINELIEEVSEASVLVARGVRPRSTLLVSGPPGVGKTSLAAEIANRLGWPLVQADVAATVSSYLGRTGQNLRAILHHAAQNEYVVLLDEFDSIAKRRSDAQEIGEMKRVVSVMLKDLEDWSGPSLIIAATNYSELLDPAIFRRFAVHVELLLPTREAAEEILGAHLEGQSIDRGVLGLCAAAMDGQSGSALRDLAQSALRGHVLGRDSTVEKGLLHRIAERCAQAGEIDRFLSIAKEFLPASDLTMGKLSEILGVAKSTVHRHTHGKRGR